MDWRNSLAVSVFFLSGISYAQILYPWMHPDVGVAWEKGYKGQGTTIQVIDHFDKDDDTTLKGNLDDHSMHLLHGEWTSKQVQMIAPAATIRHQDFFSTVFTTWGIQLRGGLNIFNLSMGASSLLISWIPLTQTIINYAQHGLAVIAYAAGNEGVAIDDANSISKGVSDRWAKNLRDTPSTIFVGALDCNGTTTFARIAKYSNMAGKDPKFQKRFLVVGVEKDKIGGLWGTSFAAPIVSGYAAILGSKFTHATPTQIVNRLLDTARRDTIEDYRPEIHGRGEASLSRALAPVSIQ